MVCWCLIACESICVCVLSVTCGFMQMIPPAQRTGGGGVSAFVVAQFECGWFNGVYMTTTRARTIASLGGRN